MDKFQNKYRIPSARLQNWDYRWAGAYFITLCTHHRQHFFGEIANGKMQLSEIGKIANELWYQIPHHAKNVELGAFVVMPNHIHGIIIITNDTDNNNNDIPASASASVETGHALSLRMPLPLWEPPPMDNPTDNPTEPVPLTIGQQRFQNIGKNSISSIVGSYKSAVTKHAHRLGFAFQWQSRFYDHIIRNNESYQNITHYIRNNPTNWKEDEFFNF